MEVTGPGAAFWSHLLSARGDWVSCIQPNFADVGDDGVQKIPTITPTRCLSFPPQCLMPVLRYCSLGSSFMLVLLPSQPCSPNSCFTGERERLIGLKSKSWSPDSCFTGECERLVGLTSKSVGWSSLMSSSCEGEGTFPLGGGLVGEGVRRIDRPLTGEGSGGL